MAPKSVTFRRHDHLVSVLFGDLFSHSYNIIFQDLKFHRIDSTSCTCVVYMYKGYLLSILSVHCPFLFAYKMDVCSSPHYVHML